jgi:hypothetical protein
MEEFKIKNKLYIKKVDFRSNLSLRFDTAPPIINWIII